MVEVNGSNSTYTLTPSISPVKVTCNINATAYIQSGVPYSIEGSNARVQVTPGSYAIYELSNNRIWRLIGGSIVAPPPTPDFISSVGNTATVLLDVTAGELTADFASLDISQFTNDSGYIDYADLSALAPMAYDNTTGQFSMTQADATTDGWLSSTDWNTFAAGDGTVKSVATAGLISGGPITTTGTITTNMNTNKLVGRGTASTGIMEEITLGTGLSLSGTTLNGQAGTVTSVSVVTNQGVSGSVATATTTPAITLNLGALTGVTSFNGLVVTANTGVVTTGAWNGSTILSTYGGTGLSSYTQGDLLYYDTGTALSKLAKNTSASRYLSNTGTSNNPAWAQVDLTNGVTGTLPVANGGTGKAYLQSPVLILTTTAVSHSGNTNETVVFAQQVPANTFAVGDNPEFNLNALRSVAAATMTVRVYINDVGTLDGSQVQVGQSSGTNSWIGFSRSSARFTTSTNFQIWDATTSGNTDLASVASITESSVAYDISLAYFWIVTVQLSTAVGTPVATLNRFILKNNRQ